MNTRPKVNETKHMIQKVYRKYDHSGKGHIDIKDLKNILRQL